MDNQTFRSLLSQSGQQIIQAAQEMNPKEEDFLRCYTTLSKSYPPDMARAALEIAITRKQARSKFPFAEKMYFTPQSLEQASSCQISSYRAARFRGLDHIIDLGCSTGGDTLALLDIAATTGVDHDPLRLAMAQANMQALGLEQRSSFIHSDLNAPLPLPRSPAIFIGLWFDPGRRRDGRRLHSVQDYRPPLAIVNNWLEDYPALGVKISPGVNLQELRDYRAEVEFISLAGELKEAVLWFGPLKTAARRATVLPGPHSFVLPAELDNEPTYSIESKMRIIPLDEPRQYIYEPDPSILRAGLVQALGVELQAAQIDQDIAYLTSDRLTKTPFARVWEVETWFPFGVKRLRAALRQRGVEQVVVKKRGSPLQPEELIRKLRLKENKATKGAERVIFLTHLRDHPIVVLCWPESKS